MSWRFVPLESWASWSMWTTNDSDDAQTIAIWPGCHANHQAVSHPFIVTLHYAFQTPKKSSAQLCRDLCHDCSWGLSDCITWGCTLSWNTVVALDFRNALTCPDMPWHSIEQPRCSMHRSKVQEESFFFTLAGLDGFPRADAGDAVQHLLRGRWNSRKWVITLIHHWFTLKR